MSRNRHLALVTAVLAAGSVAAATTATATAATAHPAAAAAVKLASVKVANKSQKVLVTASGGPVYLLTGDSKTHPQCTTAACLGNWPAVTTSAKKPALGTGIKGTLTVWTHGGHHQLVLNGHPLYTFAADSNTMANGQGLKSDGGTWDLLTASGTAFTGSTAKSSDSSSTSNSSTSSSGW